LQVGGAVASQKTGIGKIARIIGSDNLVTEARCGCDFYFGE
jgi:hypothetical protein